MKRSFLAIVFLLLSISATAFAERGEVVKRISGCDYYMVDAPSGYAVLEWYGGDDPDTGDLILGRFTTFGFHTFLVGSSQSETNAYIEDWGLSRDEALEVLVDHCE